MPKAKARVALASRIYVEGRHDAELVEQVWGADLRIEGVVVEYLGGVDDLADIVAEFAPGPGRRLGVLVDHLVTGSKEARIAEAVRRGPGGEHTLVVGHPFVDIWQSVKPARLGIKAWPTIPRSVEWKHGICEALGWPAPGPGRHRASVAADPRPRSRLERSGARADRPGRGTDRLRHRTGVGRRGGVVSRRRVRRIVRRAR